MIPIAYYLLKVIICSGILYGYYLLLLRNKVFHAYNRFYLMVAIMLSLLLPIIKINFWQAQPQVQPTVVQVLQAVAASDEYIETTIIATPPQSTFTVTQLLPFAYLLVSLILLVIFIHSLFFIYGLLKKYPVQKIENVSFINTEARSTPFSFLNNIFWNSRIDINSTTGHQIFKHELAHVQEKHSYDKLFINIVLIFFWCNPFFWLYRKELNMIHEFIADKKAVEDSDTQAFAAMILQATYPQHRFQLTNNFFYSPIKRRLMMLTKNKNPKVNYWGRIMALPLLIMVFAAFTFKNQKSKEHDAYKVIETKNVGINDVQQTVNDIAIPILQSVSTKESPSKYLDTPKLTLHIKRMNELSYDGEKTFAGIKKEYEGKKIIQVLIDLDEVVLTLIDKQKIKMSQDEAIKKGIFSRRMPIPNDLGDQVISTIKNIPNVLYIVDGVEMKNNFEKESLNPNEIAEITVLKDNSAIALYGDKGKDGVVKITTKSNKSSQINIQPHNKETPLYIIDGKEATEATMKAINPDQIKSVDVLKGDKAVEKYGEKGKYGVLEISLKKEITNLESEKDNNDVKIFSRTDNPPIFTGGADAWRAYLRKNLKADTPANEGWKEGTYTVIVKFIVMANGSISQATKENYVGSKTAQHCIDIINKSPKWNAAVQNGIKVNAYHKQPITFKIEESKKAITANF